MNEESGSATLLLVGALLVRLSVTEVYARYVRVSMGPWLLAAGVILAVAGLAGIARSFLRPQGTDGYAGHAGHGGHTERVGWLLLAPVVALLMVSPPALGSYGVDRSAVTVTQTGLTFRPLPAGPPVPMTVLEFDQRAADHRGASFGTTPVRLTGFVAGTDGNGFRLARYQIACCAADAVAAIAHVVGVSGTPPARDSWVTVTGTFRRSAGEVPDLVATSLQVITAPVDPYE